MTHNEEVETPEEESLESDDINVDWDFVPKLKDLKQDLQGALAAQATQSANVAGWLANRDANHEIETKKGRSKVQPKLIRKQAEWRYSSLSEPFLSTPDLFNGEPVSFEDKQSAIDNTLILNNQFNTKIDKVRFIDEYIRTVTDEGTVIVKTGWRSKTKVVEVTKPVMKQVPVQDPIQAQQMMVQGIPPTEQVQVGVKTFKEEKLVVNQPEYVICDINNVYVDPTCLGDYYNANFTVHTFESSINELKSYGIYHNLDDINVSTSTASESFKNPTNVSASFTFNDNGRKKIVVAEHWGFKEIYEGEGEVVVVTTWIGDTIIRMEESPLPHGKLPFTIVPYLPVKNSIYGEPEGELLEDNQKIIGALTRGIIDIMGTSANGQQGVAKGALDTVNRRKFENGEDYEFNQGTNPNSSFHMGKYPEIPQSALQLIQYINNDSESLSGVKAFSSGISGQSLGSTATSVRGALDAASKRELGILRRLANGIIDIGKKTIAMNSEFLKDEEIIRITNGEFVTISRDALAGDFDLSLSISTAEADNEKAQELAFMLQTGASSADEGEVRMIRAEIARLRKMSALAKRIEDYQPQPDPAVQKQAELQIALLEAQVANEQAKGEENRMDIRLKEAKARALESQSDLKDLEFLDKNSGADRQHEENMKDKDALLKTLTAATRVDKK